MVSSGSDRYCGKSKQCKTESTPHSNTCVGLQSHHMNERRSIRTISSSSTQGRFLFWRKRGGKKARSDQKAEQDDGIFFAFDDVRSKSAGRTYYPPRSWMSFARFCGSCLALQLLMLELMQLHASHSESRISTVPCVCLSQQNPVQVTSAWWSPVCGCPLSWRWW